MMLIKKVNIKKVKNTKQSRKHKDLGIFRTFAAP